LTSPTPDVVRQLASIMVQIPHLAQYETIFNVSAFQNDLSRDAAGARKTRLIRAIGRYIWLHVLSLDLKHIKQKTLHVAIVFKFNITVAKIVFALKET